MEFSELIRLLLLDLQRIFRSRLNIEGLTIQQVLLLSIIQDDGVEMSKLAKTLGIDNSTLTRVLDLLVKKGLVYRRKDQNDGRISLAYLTRDGEKIQTIIETELDQLGESIYLALPIDERDEMKEYLSKFQWVLAKLFFQQT